MSREEFDLALGVNSAAEYGRNPRRREEPWVHLLAEQEFDRPPFLDDLVAVRFHIEARLVRSTNLHQKDYDPDLHAAQFQVFLTVQNRDSSLKGTRLESSPTFQTNFVEGWRLLIDERLLAEDRAATGRALNLLQAQLREVSDKVPAHALRQLQQVTLWFSPAYPGLVPKAEYHPGAGWLREHSRNPDMAKGVEFTNIRQFEAETRRMPNFALHELAHAFHDQFLPEGFENERIKSAFERAKASGTYDRVERWNGDGQPASTERAYAMTNPMEFFAELTEAFFSRNDFYPFNRDELRQHDPQMEALLRELWNAEE